MFWNRKARDTADGAACALFDWGVIQPFTKDETLRLDLDPASPCSKKLRVYQFASLTLAILAAEQRDKSFTGVRVGLEKRYFVEQNMELLEEVRAAMSDLSILLWPAKDIGKPLTWARAWYATVGLDEYNPARLARFSMLWFDHFKVAADCLNKIKIVG